MCETNVLFTKQFSTFHSSHSICQNCGESDEYTLAHSSYCYSCTKELIGAEFVIPGLNEEFILPWIEQFLPA